MFILDIQTDYHIKIYHELIHKELKNTANSWNTLKNYYHQQFKNHYQRKPESRTGINYINI